jgi:phosphoserine aminotransferase
MCVCLENSLVHVQLVCELQHAMNLSELFSDFGNRTVCMQFYSAIDESNGFYVNNVHPDFRSKTSIPFRILDGDDNLETQFSEQGSLCGLHQLSGHHTCRGLRVCLYNGIPDDGLDALLYFMASFQQRFDSR